MTTIDRKFVQGLTLTEKASLVSGKDFWFTAAVPGVDRMMMTDGPSGLRKQAAGADALGLNDSVKAVCFPCSALTAASFDDDLLFKLGQQLGVAAKAEQVGVLLGPGVNIKRSPLAGRNFEYFSEDPLLAGRMGTAYVKGVQSQGVGVSVKHFAANNRENQRFTSSSNIDERTLREIYLRQFEMIVKAAQPATIMCSYNKLNGVQVSQNQRLLTRILRDEWGFDGLVMSDWGAVVDHVAALKAGLDLEMPGKGQASVDEIVAAVKEGRLQESILDTAALRVLKMAERFKTAANSTDYDRAAQHAFARQAAAAGMVLLKNDAHQLPLAADAKLTVIGELAEKPRFEGGGSSHVNAYRLVTPLAAMPQGADYQQGYRLDGQAAPDLLAAAVASAKQADRVVVFAGLPAEMESEGFDKEAIALPDNQNQLIAAVVAVNPTVTVVLQNGSVVELPWADQVPAILETYLAGEAVGEATWDVLTGAVNPSGKLSESFPIALKDTPTYRTFNADFADENYREGLLVGYRYYLTKEVPVRFAFGHGLSYTSFEYRDLRVAEGSDEVTVTFTLTNTGAVAGKEVPQVYVANRVSRVEKPAYELRNFTKVALEAGESKQVTLTLDRRAFAWYNPKTAGWQADNGDYQILVGASATDIRLQAAFTLTIGTAPQAKVTGETYVGDLMKNLTADQEKVLEELGLSDQLKSLTTGEMAAIMANIPLRSLVMAGIDAQQIKELIGKLNQ